MLNNEDWITKSAKTIAADASRFAIDPCLMVLPDIREGIREADLVLGVDKKNRGNVKVIYGSNRPKFLNRPGRPQRIQIIALLFDAATGELEHLITAVQAIKEV